jgi:regulator of sirC expression with transglutaminase-like and TPR domain
LAKIDNIHSLVNLLDDPDEGIYTHIRGEILGMGPDVIPDLEEIWEEGSLSLLFQSRIEEIIHDIRFNSVKKELNEWNKHRNEDLLEGMYLLAKYQYPELKRVEIEEPIDKLARDIWIELNENLTALEKMRVINHILYDVHGLSGNTTNYLAPTNSYLNDVLHSKKGNPISLSILNIILGDKLGLPIKGINLPRHFIIAWEDDFFSRFNEELESPIMFYANPFSKGTIFSRKDVEHFLKQINVDSLDIFFEPCDNQSIINRVINNLINSYTQQGFKEKVDDLMILQQVISPKSEE